MNNEKFAELLAEAKNKNTLDPDQATDQWEAGDTCGEKGCERAVFLSEHPRHSQMKNCPRHPDAPEKEFVCVDHGVVASR